MVAGHIRTKATLPACVCELYVAVHISIKLVMYVLKGNSVNW